MTQNQKKYTQSLNTHAMKKRFRRNQEDSNPKMKKTRKMNRHHLLNKTNGGGGSINNILWIYTERHEMWHVLFKNLNLDQVISLLIRVKSAKENQTESNRIRK